MLLRPVGSQKANSLLGTPTILASLPYACSMQGCSWTQQRKQPVECWTPVLNTQTVSHTKKRKDRDSQMAFSREYFAWGECVRPLYAWFKERHLPRYSAEQSLKKHAVKWDYVCVPQNNHGIFLHVTQELGTKGKSSWPTILWLQYIQCSSDGSFSLFHILWLLYFSMVFLHEHQNDHSLKFASRLLLFWMPNISVPQRCSSFSTNSFIAS